MVRFPTMRGMDVVTRFLGAHVKKHNAGYFNGNAFCSSVRVSRPEELVSSPHFNTSTIGPFPGFLMGLTDILVSKVAYTAGA